MKRKILVVLGLVAFLGVGLGGYVTAATEGTVNATVTAQQVAVSVSPGSVAYGALSVGTTANLPSPTSFTATNDGNVNEDFAIKGFSTTAWTLAGTAASETYVHRFSTDGGSTFTALTLTNQALASAVIPTAGQAVNLNLDMPTATAATAEQTADVKVLATAS